MSARVEHVSNERDVARKLGGGPAIFLSASVPKERTFPASLQGPERFARQRENEEYLHTAKPVQIRSAVTAITRLLMTRGLRLVFGAHPAISPMVLSAARDVIVNSREASGTPRILIFQSEYFKPELPDSTLDLASWEAGLLVFTPVVPDESGTKEGALEPSLRRMRQLMVSVPDLRAAIFIGGMDGVEKEARLFAERNPGSPMYALGSTGSAALKLMQGEFAGPALSDTPSYSVIAAEILDDLKRRSDLP